jgi:hypothetical protein
VRAANQRILHRASRDAECKGMGTTVSAAVFSEREVVLAQVGDSRGYLFRGNVLTQITRDQSVVDAMVHAGQLTESEARFSMQRGVILQALGASRDVEVSLSVAELRRGDCVMLCSDGLHEYVGHAAMQYSLATNSDLQKAAESLVGLAKTAGGADNISVALARVDGDLPEAAGAEDQPIFAEIDVGLVGEEALVQTSMVARRLAHRAGIRNTANELRIPATGQHDVVDLDELDRARAAEAAEEPNRAARLLAERKSLGIWPWVACAAVILAGLMYAFGLWP